MWGVGVVSPQVAVLVGCGLLNGCGFSGEGVVSPQGTVLAVCVLASRTTVQMASI